ncbi:MAG: hypothetical protein ISEC1_P0538 [Thiomicrorhabdus sp.]|nr:MAG: hypothetical protein ISEC1_P0538 [Thiomicrorhabdus sp.]
MVGIPAYFFQKTTMKDTAHNPSSLFGNDFNELDQKVKSLGFDGVLYAFYPKTFHKKSSF